VDSGDGTIVYLRLPTELVYLAERYQKARRLTTKNDAFRELIETHPRIAELATTLYPGRDT
jgi:hypothetical protein